MGEKMVLYRSVRILYLIKGEGTLLEGKVYNGKVRLLHWRVRVINGRVSVLYGRIRVLYARISVYTL